MLYCSICTMHRDWRQHAFSQSLTSKILVKLFYSNQYILTNWTRLEYNLPYIFTFQICPRHQIVCSREFHRICPFHCHFLLRGINETTER